MSYTLNPEEAKLPEAVAYLESVADIPGYCLGYCREALGRIGLSLPSYDTLIKAYGHSTALGAFHVLAANPAAYGFVKVGYPDVHPITVAFFHNCGYEVAANGQEIECGHIALWEKRTGWLRSSKDFRWNANWAARLVGEFVPVG